MSYTQLKQLYTKYERLLIPAMLLLGFLMDALTFQTLQIRTAFLLLGMHALVVAGMILFLNSFDEGTRTLGPKHPLRYLRLAAPLVFQFSMGALLSAVLIFYLFSGAFSVSWPFLLIIVFLMLSNEFFREYYLQPTVQLPVYYLVLFALGAILLPFAIKSIHLGVFVLSGLLAMVLLYLLYVLLRRLVPPIRQEEPRLILTIGLLFGGMIGLYILNIIPPIPLSVRVIGVYHAVERMNTEYRVLAERDSWLDGLLPGQTIVSMPGDPLFVASAIFAPTDLTLDIVHIWEWYNETGNSWEHVDTLGFGIVGGRDGGYRGYSQKSALREGTWRVSVATASGKIMGRVRFTLVFDASPPTREWHVFK